MKRRWKLSLAAFAAGFGIGLALFLCVSFVVSLFKSDGRATTRRGEPSGQNPCGAGPGFASPEEALAALRHEEVSVRREAFERLLLRPGVATSYYDYERDRDYPERAERAGVKYLNLDGRDGDEALLTFIRYENPVALILKRDECGWRLAGALSSWLRFEDYPYENWLETPLSSWLRFEDYPYENWLETPERAAGGAHDLLVRESDGDATRYARNARLLRLTGYSLAEVASFTEESIRPVAGYEGADWSDVKTREATRYTFVPPSGGRPERIRLETVVEVVKYSGAPPSYTFWLETDGAWHTARRQWRQRASARLKLLGARARELLWDERVDRFVEEK